MQRYRRVSYEQRCQISAFLETEIPIGEIANRLGLHRSTIYREITRNQDDGDRFHPNRAELKARARASRCRRKRIFDDPKRLKLLTDHLKRDFSPEQIVSRVRLASHQTIYNFIRETSSPLAKYLRRFGKRRGRGRQGRRKPRAIPPWKIPISERPIEVETRTRLGDWERDTMYVADRKMLLVCVERKSRFVRIEKLKRIEPRSTYGQSIEMMRLDQKLPLTITNDNGAEFMGETNAAIPIYFCNPFAPQERGTIENTIGLIRQYIKRNTKIGTLTSARLRKIERRLNHRPRKCLRFRTPHEVMFA